MKALLSLLFFWVFAVQAQPLTFVTITGAGSLSDTAIRQAAPAISKHTGRPVVVMNMPGGDGLVAVRYFLTTPQDTLLVGNSSLGYLEVTGRLTESLHPLSGLVVSDLVVYSRLPLSQLVELKTPMAATTSPMTELSLRRFDAQHGTKTLAVGYKQFGQAVVDLVAGRIDYLVAPMGSAAIEAAVTAGKVVRAQNLGPLWGWNAIFARSFDPTLSEQIQDAVAETAFSGANPFLGAPTEVRRIQSVEQQLMQKLVAP